MSAFRIGLDWLKDSKGYEIIDDGAGRSIIGKGGPLVPIQPLQNDMVFMAFAKIENEPELKKFVEHYGLLNNSHYRYRGAAFDANTLGAKSRPVIFGESVSDLLETAKMFHDLIALKSGGGRASKALTDWIEDQILKEELGVFSLEFVSGRGFQMVLKANSLINGLLIQLAHKIAGQSKFQRCEFCRNLFEVGPGSGRRLGATFCSEAHKVKFHSRKRSIRQK